MLALVAVSSCGPGIEHAVAQTTGGGELGPGYVRATAADLGAGTFSGGGLPAQTPGERAALHVGPRRAPVRVRRVRRAAARRRPRHPDAGPELRLPDRARCADRRAGGHGARATPTTRCPTARSSLGHLVQDVGDDPTRTGDLVIVPRCVGPRDPPLPPPPSAAEIWQQTPLPRAVIDASPPGTAAWPGITRLGSDFRSDALAPTTAAVSLHGYDVVVTAVPIAYAWTFGDGNGVVSPDAAAAPRVAYLRRGDYAVTRYVVWEGHAEVRGFGGLVAQQYLGTVTIPERRPYHVAEIRAVLRTNPAPALTAWRRRCPP